MLLSLFEHHNCFIDKAHKSKPLLTFVFKHSFSTEKNFETIFKCYLILLYVLFQNQLQVSLNTEKYANYKYAKHPEMDFKGNCALQGYISLETEVHLQYALEAQL